jgi:hypothetical protein
MLIIVRDRSNVRGARNYWIGKFQKGVIVWLTNLQDGKGSVFFSSDFVDACVFGVMSIFIVGSLSILWGVDAASLSMRISLDLNIFSLFLLTFRPQWQIDFANSLRAISHRNGLESTDIHHTLIGCISLNSQRTNIQIWTNLMAHPTQTSEHFWSPGQGEKARYLLFRVSLRYITCLT